MDEKEIYAAELALGLYSTEHKDAVPAVDPDDPEFLRHSADWTAFFEGLDEALKIEQPNPRVWDNIERRIGANNTILPEGVYAVPRTKGGWWSLSEGVDVKSLYIDPELDTESFLLRIQSGCVVEQHDHRGFADECMVIEGDILVGDVKFRPGDFHVATDGSTHPPLSSQNGGILFVRSKRVTFDQPRYE